MLDLMQLVQKEDLMQDQEDLKAILVSIHSRINQIMGGSKSFEEVVSYGSSKNPAENLRLYLIENLSLHLSRCLMTGIVANNQKSTPALAKTLRSHADALEDPLFHLKQELNELVAQGVPPDGLYYKDRPEQGVNNSPEFYRRTYKRFIDADILYLDQLRKMDKALVNAFTFHKHPPKVPTKSKRIDREVQALDEQKVGRDNMRVVRLRQKKKI